MTQIMYVGTESGVRVLTRADEGPWEIGAPSLAGFSVEAIEVAPAAPEVVFAGTRGDGVWRSADAGKSWAKPSYGRIGPGKVRSLTIDPHSDNRLWVGGEPIQVFVSEDQSANWTAVASLQNHPWVTEVTYPAPTIEPHTRDIVIDPNDAHTIYVALQLGYVLKSVDGGASWVLQRGLDCDVHQLAVDPRNSQRVLAATGGQDAQAGISQGRALYASDDGGTTWTPLAMNFEQDYALTLVLHPTNPDIMLSALAKGHPGYWHARDSGAESILVRSDDGGANWTAVDIADLSEGARHLVIAFSFDSGRPDRVYAAMSNGRLLVSDDAGRNWVDTNVMCPGVKDIRCMQA